jgi:hypothetical protein
MPMKKSDIPDRPITIDEASDLYPDEWVFMRVTACTERDTGIEGLVIRHSKRWGSVKPVVMKHLPISEEERGQYRLFHTPRPVEPEELQSEAYLDKIERIMLGL